jgi:hypothetical protein
MSFSQGNPTVSHVISTANCLVFGNTSSGNALSVQQLGAGNVVSFSNAYGGSNVFVMNNLGRVGVGTTNPGYSFDVLGVLRAGNPLSASIYLTNNEVKWRGDGTAHFSIFNQNSTFQVRNTSGNSEPGTAGSNLVSVTTAGNVGIGTTNPSCLLDVRGTSVFGDQLGVGTTTGNQSNVISQFGNGSSALVGGLKIIGTRTATGTDWTTTSLRIQKFVDSSQMGYMEFGAPGGSSDIAFGSSGGTERMRITLGGNVGIGTTSPGNMFQVGALVGPIYANNPLSQSTAIILGPSPSKPTYSGTTTLGGTLFVNATDANASNVGASIALGGRGADFGGGQQHMTFARIQGTQAVTSGAYYGNFVIETQNSGILYERMRINQDGYVGIGTASPGAPLTIISSVGQGANSTLSMADGTKSLGVVMNASGSAYNVVTNAGDTLILQSSGAPNTGAISIGPHSSGALGMRIACASNALSLYANTITTYSNASSPAALMTMTNGRVGIGTTSPAALLTCAAAYTNGGTHAEETGAKILLGANNQSGPYGVAIQCRVPANSTVNESDMQFSTCDNSGNQLVRVTIKGTSNPTGGNVGIGTASPTNLLSLYATGAAFQASTGGIILQRSDVATSWTISGPDGGNTLRVVNVSGTGVQLVNTTTAWAAASDSRLKNIIEPIANAISKTNQLSTVIYSWKTDETNAPHPGLIAQEVLEVQPEAVSEDTDGMLSVRYTELIPLAFAAIKELSAKNTALEQRLAALEAKLAA